MTYVVGDRPVLPGADALYLQTELRKIAASLRAIDDMTPKPATAEPRTRRDGMIRLARSPWRPLGGSLDLWVFFDGPSNSWKAL